MTEKGQIQFINIQGGMIYNLGLSGNELLLYALIYGYTQDGKNTYHGSLSYIQQGLQLSRPSVISLLKKLLKKGYIIKTKESHYKVSKESLLLVKKVINTSKESLLATSKESLLNNNKEIIIKNNNKEIIEKNIKKDTGLLNIKKEEVLQKYQITESELEIEVEEFINYWRAIIRNGKKSDIGKELWSVQKTFEPNLRFGTRLRNSNKWKKRVFINSEDEERKNKLAELEKRKKNLFNNI